MAGLLSGVNTLVTKAMKAHFRGSFARAAECFGDALEAACALQPADSLVLAFLRVHQAYNLYEHALTEGVPSAEKLAAQRRVLILLEAASPTLRSRRAAGTLLVGRRRAEDALAAHFEAENRKLMAKDYPLPSDTFSLTSVFRDTYLLAAYTALRTRQAMLLNVDVPAALTLPEMSEELILAHFSFVASALDLMAEPWLPRGIESVSPIAAMLVKIVRYLLQHGAGDAVVSGAWERLQRSGALQLSIMDEGMERALRGESDTKSAVKAAIAQRGLRSCALEGCAAREVSVSQFKGCGACKTVVYCCREHQLEHWPAHKAACKAARKAAASASCA